MEDDDDDYVEPALEVYKQRPSDDVPPEFRCAINGHLLKEPARTPQGLVFERATIKLWLETRGSVCPLTGEALTLDDLIDDRDLRARASSRGSSPRRKRRRDERLGGARRRGRPALTFTLPYTDDRWFNNWDVSLFALRAGGGV